MNPHDSPLGSSDCLDVARSAQPSTKQDLHHLQTLGAKLQMVRDRVASVALGFTTGFYLYGPGGCGKSFSVIEELKRLEAPYRLFNSRMTGRSLFNALAESPDAVHLLEDMEQLFHDSGAKGVLRSALWGQPQEESKVGPIERRVTWSTHRMNYEFIFTGGIIMTANRPFPDSPELEAVRTRIAYMQLVASDNELKALMRYIAAKGYRRGHDRMDPPECKEICECVIEACLGLNRALDIRLLVNGFQDYLQWRECQSGCHWRDMIAARVKQRPIVLEEAEPPTRRAQQKRQELEIAAELLRSVQDPAERCQLWTSRTGKSPQTYYRRVKELREEEEKKTENAV
jgi:hypothetical protein